MAVRTAERARQLLNVVNLSTPLGLLVAVLCRARLEHAPDGLILAWGYRLRVPPVPAFTIGNVVLLKIDDAELALRPQLLAHEARHASQYAACLGVLMLPLYLVAAAWSWLRCRDFATYNVFERLAGLSDGGYGRGRQLPRDGAQMPHGRP